MKFSNTSNLWNRNFRKAKGEARHAASDINLAEVKEAMEAITEQDVKDWLKENIVESLFSKRLKFCQLRKNNQKLSQEIFDNFTACA